MKTKYLNLGQIAFSICCLGYIAYKATRPKTEIQREFEEMIFGNPKIIKEKALFI